MSADDEAVARQLWKLMIDKVMQGPVSNAAEAEARGIWIRGQVAAALTAIRLPLEAERDKLRVALRACRTVAMDQKRLHGIGCDDGLPRLSVSIADMVTRALKGEDSREDEAVSDPRPEAVELLQAFAVAVGGELGLRTIRVALALSEQWKAE